MNKHTLMLISTILYFFALVCLGVFFFGSRGIYLAVGLILALVGWFFKWLVNR